MKPERREQSFLWTAQPCYPEVFLQGRRSVGFFTALVIPEFWWTAAEIHSSSTPSGHIELRWNRWSDAGTEWAVMCVRFTSHFSTNALSDASLTHRHSLHFVLTFFKSNTCLLINKHAFFSPERLLFTHQLVAVVAVLVLESKWSHSSAFHW